MIDSNEPRILGESTEKADVVLINMPFGHLYQPSLPLGLLQSSLDPLDLRVRTLYLNMDLACRGDLSFYRWLCEDPYMSSHYRPGAWMFSRHLHGPEKPDADAYLDGLLRPYLQSKQDEGTLSESPDQFIRSMRNLTRSLDGLVDSWLNLILDLDPALVGFSSNHQQQVSSLLLARRIKRAAPDTQVVLGGSNCESVLGAETLRQFPFLDAVVSGEGDRVFPTLTERLLAGESVSDLQGVYTTENLEAVWDQQCPITPMIMDMDSLPYPDYDDYFEQITRTGLIESVDPYLPFETSRGCWWGEKKLCTFCGTNGLDLAYRSKSADRAMDELLHLLDQYEFHFIVAVDVILDMGYFEDFIPQLAEKNLDYSMSYEVKSNLTRDHVQKLQDAGVTWIHTGIESLSSPVLKIMKKGVSEIQNIELLKAGEEFEVTLGWNFLWGFPGESAEEYQRMAQFVPYLSHLPPPARADTIGLPRFSPYFDNADEYGFTNLTPKPAYNHVYPFSDEAVFNLAHYFDFEYADHPSPDEYTAELNRAIERWQQDHEDSALFSVELEDHVLIWDFRPATETLLAVLSSTTKHLYTLCESVCSIRELRKTLEEQHGVSLDGEQIQRRLEPLRQHHLIYNEGKRYLNLAVPTGEYSPEEQHLRRLLETLQTKAPRIRQGEFEIPLPRSPGEEVRFLKDIPQPAVV